MLAYLRSFVFSSEAYALETIYLQLFPLLLYYNTMIQHLNLEIYSRAKDPFFLRTLRHKANALELKGFIETREDGAIYVELEGEDENVKKFLAEYQHGDESKSIIRMEPSFTNDYKGYDSFEIKE
jgi:acylphosphatase